jgi:hypothetical protein
VLEMMVQPELGPPKLEVVVVEALELESPVQPKWWSQLGEVVAGEEYSELRDLHGATGFQTYPQS